MSAKNFAIQYPASLAEAVEHDHDDPAKNAKRQRLWSKQRRERGFDDSELWDLDHTFARLMLPRVKAFLVQHEEMTVEDKRWKRDMAVIVKAMELLSDGEVWCAGEEAEQIAKGMRVFAKRIREMWT